MAATAHPTRHPDPASQAERVIRTFRWISWQRIELGADGSGRGLVTGLRHRLPSTIEVSLGTAYELRRRGVRTVVHRVKSVA
jgi:hypothetical protein